MAKMWRWTIVSLFAGVVLGLFLKAVQAWTDVKVYTLLLNIDYIPMLDRLNFGELFELALHLVVGVVIGNVLQRGIDKFKLVQNQRFIVIIVASLTVAITYYPVTTLSERTPDFLSISAFSWWIIGHFLYGVAFYFAMNQIVEK